MAQVLEFKLPDLGEGLTEALIVRWLVEVGEVVAVDQPVVEVETAKAMVEVPCPYGGVVTARFGAEGTELPVGAPLLTVAVGSQTSGTDTGSGTGDGAGSGPGTSTGSGTGSGSGMGGGAVAGSGSGMGAGGGSGSGTGASGNVLVGYGTSSAPARRRRVRPDPGVFSSASAGTSASPRSPDPVGAGGADAGAGAVSGADGADGTDGTGTAARAARLDAGAGADRPVPVISPLVRRLARDHGLNLRELSGSGPEGLILRADVEDALRAQAARERTARATASTSPASSTSLASSAPPVTAPASSASAHAPAPAPSAHAPATTPAPSAPGPGSASPLAPAPAVAARNGANGGTGSGGGEDRVTRVPLKGVRGVAADRLSRSRREIPDATCWVDADATELLRARTAMNAAGGPRVSLLALLARICTAALARYPELNSAVDTRAREIVRFGHVHLGFAAQTERGLMVPVVRDAHARDAEGLTAEFARLTEAARAGTLTPGELTGGTFTLNNYGVFGVDGSTPIINHPEAAMLGVGRIAPKPWVHEGELAVRQVVQLSLTFDHRVCDGGTAGGFLRYVADCVEVPAVLLRTL